MEGSESQFRRCTPLASGIKMVEHNFLALKVPVRGVKANFPAYSVEERNEIDGQLDFLHQLISAERVVKGSHRSIGVYDCDKNRVRLTEKRNKWQKMGYNDGGEWYFAAHEALYMLEMNYLEVTFGEVVMSVEQAYSLFVGRSGCLTLEQYFVFATLTRIGYTVLEYDRVADERHGRKDEAEGRLDAESETVWRTLFQLLGETEGESEMCEKFRETNNRTIQSTPVEVALSSDAWPTRAKRKSKASDRESTKKQKVRPSHHLDRLTYEPEYTEFANVFAKIEIVEGRHYTESIADVETVPELQFDLYTPNQVVKRSDPGIPSYRMIVRRTSDPFISNTQAWNCLHSQQFPVPILLVVVTESMSMHSFLYKF